MIQDEDLQTLRVDRGAAEASARRRAAAITEASLKPGASTDLKEWSEVVSLLIENAELRARLFDKRELARDTAAEMERQRNLAEERISREVLKLPKASSDERIAIAHEVASAEKRRLEQDAPALIEAYILKHELDAWLVAAGELESILEATATERALLDDKPSVN